MDLFTEARLEQPFRAAARDLTRLYAGFYVAELLEALTDQRDPHPRLFRSALVALRNIGGNADVATEVLRFELMTLKDLGHLPSLSDCVECGRPLEPQGQRVAFGLVAGGVLCADCKLRQRPVVAVRRSAIHVLQQLCSDPGLDQPAEVDRSIRGELRGLLTNYISHLLGRRPRMAPFLTTLR